MNKPLVNSVLEFFASKIIIFVTVLLVLFGASNEARANNLEKYKNYYLRGVFSVESEWMDGSDQKFKRYFVIYDNKIFTTRNDVSINDNRKVSDGKYTLETDFAARIDVVVKNGEIKDIKPFVEEKIKKEKVIKEPNCLTAEFLYNFYVLYTGIDEKIFSQKIWSNERLRIYEVKYLKEKFNLLILDDQIGVSIDDMNGYDDKRINLENNKIFCFRNLLDNKLTMTSNINQQCHFVIKNCNLIKK